MPRPSTLPSWSTTANYPPGTDPWSGTPTTVAPSAGTQAQGFIPNTKSPAQIFNWLWNFVWQWVAYFDTWRTPPSTTTDVPQVTYVDAAGNLREFVDHNGYALGPVSELREEWSGITASTSGPVANNPRWTASISAGNIATSNPTATYPAPFLTFTSTSSTGVNYLTSTQGPIHSGFNGLAAVFAVDVGMAAAPVGTNTGFQLGLMMTGPTYIPHSAIFQVKQGVTNWTVIVGDGAASSISHDTGIAVTYASGQPSIRLKIELYGSATPYGLTGPTRGYAKFWINGALGWATPLADITGAVLYPTFEVISDASNMQPAMYVGPLRMKWNRFLNAVPAI